MGEAEYYTLIKAATEGLGLVGLGRDLAYEFQLRIHLDSNTALVIASTLALGMVRHMEVCYLRAQAAYRRTRLEVCKLPGWRNPADVLTNAMRAGDMLKKMRRVGAIFARIHLNMADELEADKGGMS